MKHINEVTLIGNVGKDIKINEIGSGEKCANFSVATSTGWKDKETGEWKNFTEWHKIVVFNPTLVLACENKLKSGMPVYIKGELKTRTWKRKDGNDTQITEIVLKNFKGDLIILEKPLKDDEQESVSYKSKKYANRLDLDDLKYIAPLDLDDLDDDIPF